MVGVGCAAAALSSVGCSSSDDGSSAAIPLDQFPQKFSSALCNDVEPCCKSDSIAYDSNDCMQAATRSFTDLVTEHRGSSYDSKAAGQCLSSLVSALKSCVSLDDAALSSACNHLFVPTSLDGATCTSDSDCVSNDCFFDLSSSVSVGAGTCLGSTPPSDPKHGKLGNPCTGQCYDDDGFDSCPTAAVSGDTFCYESEGFLCSEDTSVCTALPAIGQACAQGSYCAVGAYCNQGLCAARIASGSCEADNECTADSYCTTGAGFSRTVGECQPKKPDGYACVTPQECKNAKCNAQGSCGPEHAASIATCSGSFL